MPYVDEDGRYPIADTAHAMRVGQALEAARRYLDAESIVAVLGPAGEPTAAFVVGTDRGLTLTVIVQ